MNEKLKVDHVVLDAGAIIKGQVNNFHNFGVKFYTIHEIIDEVRDKKGREKLSSLPFDVEIKIPSRVGMRVVSLFAKKSGDFAQLSLNDIKLLALTYDLSILIDPSIPAATEASSIVDVSGKLIEGGKVSIAMVQEDIDDAANARNRENTTEQKRVWNNLSEMKTSERVLQQKNELCKQDTEKLARNRVDKDQCLFVDEDFPTLTDLVSAIPKNSIVHLPITLRSKDTSTSIEGSADQSTTSSALQEEIEATTKEPNVAIINNVSGPFTSITSFSIPSRILSGGLEKSSVERSTFCDDCDIDWITSSNIAHCKVTGEGTPGCANNITGKQVSLAHENHTPPKVACLTTDFTMQNVLLRMKMNIMSIDGMLIKSLRQWVLRCGACFQIHYKMDLLFCSKCGSNFMQRVASSFDEKTGNLRLHLKKNYVPVTRGTKHSLPLPGKQGRYDGELLLREDQLFFGIWRQKIMKIKKDVKCVFGDDIASGLGVHTNKSVRVKVGLGHNNPNSIKGREKRGKRKKK